MGFLSMSKFTVCVFGIALLLSIQSTIADDDSDGEPELEIEEIQPDWMVRFPIDSLTLEAGNRAELVFQLVGLDTIHLLETKAEIRVISSHPDIVYVSKVIPLDEIDDGIWIGLLGIFPVAIGTAEIYVEICIGTEIEKSSQTLNVTVEKSELSTIESIVKYLIGEDVSQILHVLLFFNFGIMINLKNVKTVFRKPYGIIIALVLNVLMIPVVSNSFFSKLIDHPIN